MAIIWQKNIDGTKYEVRAAGKTRRLYTNGVCHSEFNPDKLVTGSISWPVPHKNASSAKYSSLRSMLRSIAVLPVSSR